MTESKDWYKESFGSAYLRLYRHRDDAAARREVNLLLDQLSLPAASRVLDVCCGNGRHMRTFTERGLDVWGLDLSADLLAVASANRRLTGRLVQADMRQLPWRPVFDAAFNLFTSFGYFHDPAENLAALSAMAKVLKPGGLLVLDHANRSQVVANLVSESEQEMDGCPVHVRRWIDGDRVIKRMQVMDPDDPSVMREFIEDVRLYRPEEMQQIFERAGLAVERQMGYFDGSALRTDSPRMITVGLMR